MSTGARALVALILALLPLQAAARVPACADRGALLAHLAENWGETQQIIATSPTGQFLVEVYANTETGTWSYLTTDPDNRTCIIAAGRNFELVGPPDVPKGTAL